MNRTRGFVNLNRFKHSKAIKRFSKVRDRFPRRGVAQPGSAPEWGSGGRRFKSARPDHTLKIG